MLLRLATVDDVNEANEIYSAAKNFMKSNGNPDQWSGNYPDKSDILDGIERGVSYVLVDDGEIVATFHFEMNAKDSCYERVHGGGWKNEKPYAAIHRIAVKHHGRGLVGICFDECYKRFPNLKIDTHRDNIPMQKCLTKNGFEYCGIIYLENGDERLAYQKV